MYRNAPSGPRRGPKWSRLRQLDPPGPSAGRPPSRDSHGSIRSESTHSTIKDAAHGRVRERFCTIVVNDGYLNDAVLVNLDRLRSDVEAGSLMAITAVKGDPPSAGTAYGSLAKTPTAHNGGPPGLPDKEAISSRYVFIARDMTNEMKGRHPDVDIIIPKHIADAFGMRKSSHVLLSPVSSSSRAKPVLCHQAAATDMSPCL